MSEHVLRGKVRGPIEMRGKVRGPIEMRGEMRRSAGISISVETPIQAGGFGFNFGRNFGE